jgi:class 3 adenylate cyclase/tetratricopeptide (TPR) repeat protein
LGPPGLHFRPNRLGGRPLICPNCSTENRAGRRFCSQCGNALAVACPSCGAANEPDDRFCGQCGSPLDEAAERAPVSREAPTAERRLVSVLFADLVGFTTLSESRDSEEVRELLSRYFDTSRTLIARYGGTIEKFIGDAVMAVWGTPVAQEDDAERAVRAALDLVAAVAALGQEVGAPDLQARAGVLTGEAAVTLGAEGQGMVAGDLVNTASRLQSAAEPGTVLVGDSTRRATDAAIAYQDAGDHELKGKAEPMRLWKASRVVAGVGGALKSTGLEAPFVGRDRELRLVKELFHASAEEGKVHLVSIVGVAGIGKSRVGWEFYKYMDGLRELFRWHRGRCLAYGDGVTYWALAEMIRGRAEILEGEEASAAQAKLHSAVERYVSDPEERRWVEPRLAHLIGLEERAARDREDLFAGWRLFFERMAEERPVILSFEDMQWADAALLDFIEYLLEWSRSHPIYMLIMARPELLERRRDWGAGKRNFTSLYLEPLAPEAMRYLLAGLVPGLPDGLRDQILDRAEGVPLYAVETVRMLLDRGLLVQEGNEYRPTGPIEALEIPETLHALIAARLDGLGPEERRLLQDAAVLGKTFTKAALAAITGQSEEALEPLLTSLVHKEVLGIQADPRSPERGQFGFLQDLVKRVAYETLSKRERKAKHLAVAALLEETWALEEEDVVEVLASHYLDAYHAAPDAPDAPEIKARARDRMARAGERAASLAANQQAQHYFEQAIELTDDPLMQAELHERAGRMAWTGGRAADARSHHERAIAAFESIGLTHPAARVSAALAEVTWQEGHIEEAVQRMEAAFAVLSGEEQDADLAALAAQLGRLLYFSGRTDEALVRIELALEIGEALLLPEVLSQALNTKGLILGTRGRFEEGTILVRHSLQLALDNDLSAAALRAMGNLGALASWRDRLEEVMDWAERGLEYARKVGDRIWELSALLGPTPDLTYLGRWDEAVALVEEFGDYEDLPEGILIGVLMLAHVYVHRGDMDAARNLLALIPEGESAHDVQTRAAYQVARSPLLRAEGRFVEALAAGQDAYRTRHELGLQHQAVKEGLVEALEAAFALGDLEVTEQVLREIEALRPGELSPYVQAQGTRFGARLAAARSDGERVELGFVAAADRFREIGMPFWTAVTLLEHGEWLAGQGRYPEAVPLLDEAQETFERLRAGPWLERLERTQTGVGVSP